MSITGIIVLGVVIVVGIIALIVLKIRWNKKAAQEWAARNAAREEPPK